MQKDEEKHCILKVTTILIHSRFLTWNRLHLHIQGLITIC